MQKTLKRLILIQLAVFLLNACAQFENEQGAPTQKLVEKKVAASVFADLVTYQVTPTSEPEKYTVSFVWPKLEQGSRVRITMNKNVTMVEADQTGFKQEVTHNQSTVYFFEIIDPRNNLLRTFSKNIIIPRDFVVREGQSEFFEKTELTVNRFFLNSTVPLTTNGNEITIKTKELISDEGIIQTFIEKNKAKPSTDGRNGGKLIINAENAVGKLSVFMRGEHGGNGEDGGEYSSIADAGSNAGIGHVECETTCVGARCPMANLTTCSCLSVGKNATNGANGLDGKNGGNAGNGGNTGNLLLQIKEGKDFVVQVVKEKGLSGFPGKKGIGQIGGPGGLGRIGDRHNKKNPDCQGEPGKNGTNGMPGIDGIEGIDGKEENSCIHIESEQRNECY